jgi:two-component system, chemotaxis family, sensor histidine kinase and response regulator PixL
MTPRVLIVDDEPGDAEQLVTYLRSEGYEVLFRDSGSEALSLIRQEDIQAVICDLEMPGIDGYRVLEAVGRNPKTRHVPFMLANETWNEENWSRRAGGRTADCHFPKPYCPREVACFLRRVVDSANKGAA